MKKIFGMVSCCLLVTSLVVAQKTDTSTQLSANALHDMCLQKRKTNNTVGYVLLGSGITLMGIGFATYFSEQINSTYNNVGEPLFYVGLTASLISFPFFIAARQNKNKAKMALKMKLFLLGTRCLGNLIMQHFR